MKVRKLLFPMLLLFFFTYCKKEQKLKFSRTKDGLQYVFIIENPDNPQPKPGEGVVLDVKFYYKDSLLFNSKELGHAFRIPVSEPKYKASIDEALMMMHVGDSAIFKINAFDFYKYNADKTPMPEFIPKGDSLVFYIKMLKILTAEEIQKEKQRLNRLQALKEMDLLYEYLEEHNIEIEPSSSGLYYIELKKGYGQSPKYGDSVIFHYTVWLIDGEKIDSSEDTGKPLRAKIGAGELYPGVEEGLTYMQEGGEAKLIVPSHLALGDKGMADIIPPYSTLIFQIKLLKVKPSK